MKNKITAGLLAGVMCVAGLAFAGCGGGGTTTDNTYNLKVWGSQQDQVLLQTMAESFEEHYKDEFKVKFTWGVVGENDTRKNITDDPSNAADVFSFPDDQLYDMVNATILYEVKNIGENKFKDEITNDIVPGGITNATKDGKLYGIPYTTNTWFMLYDKQMMGDCDMTDFDAIIEKCKSINKKVLFNYGDGWYGSSFFLSAGGTVGPDGKKLTCDFNNAKGLAAAKAYDKYLLSGAIKTGDDAIVTSTTAGLGGECAVVLTGSWNVSTLKESLGERLGAAMLPKLNIGGEKVAWKNFGGYKMIGVYAGTKAPKAALLFAQWITNEQNQLLRFKERGMTPTNIKAQDNAEVKANAPVAAEAAQMVNAVSQLEILTQFWDPVAGFGNFVGESTHVSGGVPYSDAELQAELDKMVRSITT